MKSISEIIKTSNDSIVTRLPQELSPATQQRITAIRQQWPSLKSFASVFSPSETPRFSAYPTRCLMGSAPSLVELNISYGPTSAIVWMIAHLQVFQEGINVPNKMTPAQLEHCAQMIAENFHYLKTTEIMLFLGRLTGGSYSIDWHGYITPDKIVNALREKFMPYRNDLFHKHELQQRERLRKEEEKQVHLTREEWEKKKLLKLNET